MSRYEIARIPHVTGGAGARASAGGIAARHVGKGAAVLLVADPGLATTGLTDDVRRSLAEADLAVEVFSDFGGDPTVASVDAAADAARRIGAKAVVALGGGSALDLGKTAAAVAPAPLSAVDYELCKQDLPAGGLVRIAIPTTSGTGSEMTRTAIVTRADKAKVWLWGDEIKADEVILDPETTLSLPPHLTAQTGIDALVHALEAATNGNATAANNVFAHEAIRLCARSLERAVADGRDLAAREDLQRAAALAGTAIDNGGTAAAHMIGHALASIRPLHHGRSVALGLIATLAWNIEDDDGRFDLAARAMGLGSARDLPGAFERLTRALGIRIWLADEFGGVAAEQLAEQMARPENAAMRNSNRRSIGDADLRAFAETVLGQA